MAWNPYTEPVNYVMFAGQRTPGIAEVIGANAPRRWDERESYGWSGAFIVYHGQKLSHFTVRLRLYTEQDWEDWAAFKPLVDKVPLGKRQGPLDLVHPQLAQVGIKSAAVEDVYIEELYDPGVWQIDIKMIEYRSPRLALAQARGSKATPADPEDAELLENEATRAALAQQLALEETK